jgi:hypothetical protein
MSHQDDSHFLSIDKQLKEAFLVFTPNKVKEMLLTYGSEKMNIALENLKKQDTGQIMYRERYILKVLKDSPLHPPQERRTITPLPAWYRYQEELRELLKKQRAAEAGEGTLTAAELDRLNELVPLSPRIRALDANKTKD